MRYPLNSCKEFVIHYIPRNDAKEGSDNYKNNGEQEMKSAKKGRKQGRAHAI